VTADDFGLAREVNEAVEAAHTGGILTAASLMVAGPAAADAVARARRLPRLRVGLHLVLVEGRPVLPPEQLPDRRRDRTLRNDLARPASTLAARVTRRQVAAEIGRSSWPIVRPGSRSTTPMRTSIFTCTRRSRI
jgi:predicted glycoside hydrolase/deacetylase ChbG (UPF0249 family)